MNARAPGARRAAATTAAASRWPLPRVVAAREAAALDAAAIASGVPSRALMQRAGAAAASEIARGHADALAAPVVVFAGPGNNGGDGWVVARALAAAGVAVHVVAVGPSRTPDAAAERLLAEPGVTIGNEPPAGARLVIDALLGTGSSGAPRGAIAQAVTRIHAARAAGAAVVALDIPTGVDADTGVARGAVRAHRTLTFGTIKRGLLVARAHAGRITLLDIGLARDAPAEAPLLVTPRWVAERVPPIPPDAHKGTRCKLVIVGGAVGMAGAPMLAARAAMRSGIGMVRLVVERPNVAVVQAALGGAMARAWPGPDGAAVREAIADWADVVLVGPGLGRTEGARSLVERVLESWHGPIVLDADALNAFPDGAARLGLALGERAAILTPHPLEFARLAGVDSARVLAERYDIGAGLARATGAAVLLKGVPTVVTASDGARAVSAAGTPALAAAGSGDLLSGIAATLLAQTGAPFDAAACAAWVHGRAAELAGGPRGARGVVLEDVERALARVWSEPHGRPLYPVLADLPRIGRAFA